MEICKILQCFNESLTNCQKNWESTRSKSILKLSPPIEIGDRNDTCSVLTCSVLSIDLQSIKYFVALLNATVTNHEMLVCADCYGIGLLAVLKRKWNGNEWNAKS